MIMSKILFTDIQIQKLSKNKWIKNITSKGITYTDDFKIKLVKECDENIGTLHKLKVCRVCCEAQSEMVKKIEKKIRKPQSRHRYL